MLAGLHNGLVGDSSRASRGILESFDPESILATKSAPLVNIDGGLALSKVRRATLPVVVLPLFQEFGDSLQTVVDSIYRLQQTSLAFRVVTVTDIPDFKSIRPFGWTITHIIEEASWNIDDMPWRKYVHNELNNIIKNFGGNFFLKITKHGVSNEDWQRLCEISGFSPSKIIFPDVTLNSKQSSWRGWLPLVPQGKSTHEVIIGSAQWKAEIEKYANSSLVLITDLDPAVSRLIDIVRSRGWNVVRLSFNTEAERMLNSKLAYDAIFDALSFSKGGLNMFDKPILDEILKNSTSSDLVSFIKSMEFRALAEWAA